MGIIDMEEKNNSNLDGNSLKSAWKLLVIFNILAFVSLLNPLVALVCIIVSFIVAIYFLVAFNNSKNLYYDTVDKHFD